MKQKALAYLLYLLLFSLPSMAVMGQGIDAPRRVRVQAYQHELELTWATDANTQWEVVLDDEAPRLVTTPHYTFTGLVQNTQHTLKVRALREGIASPYTTLTATTQNLEKAVDDESRIPYLRTVRIDGMTPKRLPLYFNELANVNAAITYTYNGVPQHPIDNHLDLSSSDARGKLEVSIDEGNGKTWRIVYLLFLGQ